MAKWAFLFPGQGSQYVGMGKELKDNFKAAADVFAEADAALGESLSTMCFEGPEDALKLTANTQPCILTVSVAALRVLQQETGLVPAVVGGHSLGEYSALVASGALAFADAVRVVRKRGHLCRKLFRLVWAAWPQYSAWILRRSSRSAQMLRRASMLRRPIITVRARLLFPAISKLSSGLLRRPRPKAPSAP